jgi:DNA repair protein RadC
MESNKKLSIKEWAVDDRPREKMVKKGIDALSNAELIAILFRTGTNNESAVGLARNILDLVGNNINELAKLSLKDLQQVKGIGEAKAIAVHTALELGKRRKIEKVIERKKIQSSRDAFEIFGSLLGDLPYEEFWIILLNRSNSIIDRIKISQGGISGTVTDVRIILKYALENMASGLILVHNHPSGNLKPSDSDASITQKVKDAGKLMDIAVLDHIIISESGYYSFADAGKL